MLICSLQKDFFNGKCLLLERLSYFGSLLRNTQHYKRLYFYFVWAQSVLNHILWGPLFTTPFIITFKLSFTSHPTCTSWPELLSASLWIRSEDHLWKEELAEGEAESIRRRLGSWDHLQGVCISSRTNAWSGTKEGPFHSKMLTHYGCLAGIRCCKWSLQVALEKYLELQTLKNAKSLTLKFWSLPHLCVFLEVTLESGSILATQPSQPCQ